MQDKQKVTLYLPSSLHRQLKVKAAIDTESMSALVEKAISFYLKHPEAVEEVEATYGKTHQVHICPECSAATIIKDGEMLSLKNQPSVIDEEFPSVGDKISREINSKDQEELVPC
jgi:Sec7-like guanine-nucleotide exchange factor